MPTAIVEEIETPTERIEPTNTPAPLKIFAPKEELDFKPVEEGASIGAFTCNCSKTCSQISSCEEAQYLLNECGCSARDADDDGIACDNQCQ